MSYRAILAISLIFFSLRAQAVKWDSGCADQYNFSLAACADIFNGGSVDTTGWHTVAPYNASTWHGATQTIYTYYFGCDDDLHNGYTSQCTIVDNINAPSLPSDQPDNNSCQKASVIDVNSLSLGERIPIVGSDFFLSYRTDRSGSRAADYTLHLPLLSATPDSDITSVTVNVVIAGRSFSQTLTAAPNLSYDFVWDGLDNTGALVVGKALATVSISQSYTSAATDYPSTMGIWMGEMNNSIFGLGGWSLSSVHFYNFAQKKLYRGDGEISTVPAKLISSQYLVASEDGGEIYAFNSSGQHLSTKNALTGATLYAFAYDTQGRLLSVTDAYSNQFLVNRSAGVPTSLQAPFGQITALSLNSHGYLATVTNPNSESYQMTYYGSGGMLNTFQKPNGQTSTMTYDTDGYLSQDQSGSSYLQFLRSVTAVTSTPLTLAPATSVQSTSSEGVIKIFNSSVDVSGNQAIDSSDPDYMTPSRSYSPGLQRTSSFLGGTVYNSQTLQDDERLSGIYSRPSDISTTYAGMSSAYDTTISQTVSWGGGSIANPFSYSSLTTSATNNSKTTSSVYALSSGTTTLTSPTGRVAYKTTDTYGNLTSQQWASYAPLSYGYDTHGRLHTLTQSFRTTTLSYDTLGNLLSVTDPASQTTSYTYDLAGRELTATLPDARVVSYGYDSDGNLVSIAPPSPSLTHTFAYDGFDNVASYTPPALGGATVLTQYTYNTDKLPTLITRPDGQTIAYTYSGSHLPIQITTTAGTYNLSWNSGSLFSISSPDSVLTSLSTIGLFSSGNGNTDSTTGASFGSVALTYNTDYLLSNSTVSPGSGSTTSSINFAYDNDGLLTTAGNETITRSATTGQITNTALDKIKDVLTYDSTYGELATYTANYNPSGTTLNLLFSESYTRDVLGRISSKTENIGGATNTYVYTYDSANRLSGVTKNLTSYGSYSFDSNSNRTSGTQGGVSFTSTFDAQDRLSTFNTKTYYYNVNGERTSVVNTSPSGTTSYTYDTFGNLTSVTLPSGSIVTYKLDGLGRRISKKIGSTVKAYWVYDGSKLTAELNSSKVIVKRFVYSSKSNVPGYAVISGTRYRIISDSIGSVRLVVKSSDGTIAQRIDYDEFGKVLSDTNPGFQPFGYSGGLYDPDTGLVHMGARDYDSEVGRFLTKDSIMFGPRAGVSPEDLIQPILNRTSGGGLSAMKEVLRTMRVETNLYGYTMNDPINHIDPRGTDDEDSDGGDVDSDWVQHRVNEMKNDLNAAYKNCSDKLKQITKSAKDDLKDLTNAFDQFNQSVTDDQNKNQTP